MSTPGLGESQTQFPQSQWPRPKHTGPRRVPFLFVKVGLHLRSGSSFSSGVPLGHLKTWVGVMNFLSISVKTLHYKRQYPFWCKTFISILETNQWYDLFNVLNYFKVDW